MFTQALHRNDYKAVSGHDVEQNDVEARRGMQYKYLSVGALIPLHWMLHMCMILAIMLLVRVLYHDRQDWHESCALKHNIWSPAVDLQDRTQETTFFGTFDGITPFKGPPNESTEAAWDTMWNYNTVNLTAEQMVELGRPLDSIQYPDRHGGGYLAQVEMIHQLHCLHIIWQDHHYERVPLLVEERKNRPDYHERHFQHCIDIIRQRLLCTADPGLVTFRWVEGEDHTPEPDFNTRHMCSDWKRLIEWNNVNAASVNVDTVRWQAPDGVKKLAEAP